MRKGAACGRDVRTDVYGGQFAMIFAKVYTEKRCLSRLFLRSLAVVPEKMGCGQGNGRRALWAKDIPRKYQLAR